MSFVVPAEATALFRHPQDHLALPACRVSSALLCFSLRFNAVAPMWSAASLTYFRHLTAILAFVVVRTFHVTCFFFELRYYYALIDSASCRYY